MTVYDMVKQILTQACPNVYHNKALKEPDEYITWRIFGKKSFRADNMQDEAAGRYEVTVHTKKEFSDVPGELERLCDLNDEVALDDPACSYNEKTGYNHYVYILEVT